MLPWPFVTLSAYAVFIVLAIWMVRGAATAAEDAPETSFSFGRLDLLFVLAATLFIVTSRLPILELGRDLQPDEAQFSANAMMAAVHGWLNWDSSDSGSSGPLQVMLQAWPLLLNLDITFTTMHITGAVMACALSCMVYLALRIEFGRVYALLFALPTVLLLGASTYWDLVHTSSLYLPLTFATFGLATMMWIRRRPNTLLAMAGAFALGMIVLTKLQAAPLGFYIGVGLLVVHIRLAPSWTARIGKALLLIVAALLPLGLSLTPLILSGHVGDFVTETVIYSLAYVSGPINPLKWAKAILEIPLLTALVSLFGLVIVICGCKWLMNWRRNDIFTPFAIGLSLMATLCIISTGKPHQLYLLFLVPTLPFTAATLARETLSRKPMRLSLGRGTAGVALAGVALVMFPSAVIEAERNPIFNDQGALAAPGMRFRSPHILQSLVLRKDDSLIVYGYMPYFYVLAGMQPGTRETWGENVILHHNYSSRDAYRKRFIGEMDKRRPAVVVDTVSFTGFVYRDPVEQGPSDFPALAERLSRDYVKISHGAQTDGCPPVYLLRDRLDHLSAMTAEVASVTASGALQDSTGVYTPEHVVDRDIFEACNDRWIAPTAAPASLDLKLTKEERISHIGLLNTRGQWRKPDREDWSYEDTIVNNVATYHAANTAVVRLMNGDKVVAERQVTVDAYPYWTDVDFGNLTETADHVAIAFPDWRGAGPGLNEVTVYRAEQVTAGP